jgi:glycosyltransferase involved in cell wall biosynthesis
MTSLYLCYQSVREPLTRTQVIAYLEGLAAAGHRIVLLTFEPVRLGGDERRRLRAELRGLGIHWHHLRYHKRPTVPATAWDMGMGVLFGLLLSARYGVRLVHARSHVPGVMGLTLKRLTGARFLLDVRGLLAEEYVDAGVWPANGRLFRGTKRMERALVRAADAVVVLTHRAADLLRAWYPHELTETPIEVIPCCVDLRSAAPAGDGGGLDPVRRMVYIGKLGGWYWEEAMLDFVEVARDAMPGLRLDVWTQSDPSRLRELVGARALTDHVSIDSTTPDRIPDVLARADAGLSFIHPSPSKAASSPTKIGEYLAAGLPVVANAGVGDVDALLAGSEEDGPVGVIARADREGMREAAAALGALLEAPGLGERCRRAAERTLDLQRVGWPRYRALYQRLERR